MTGRVRRRDDGASLVLALIFITVVGIVLLALLPYAQSGVTAAVTVRDTRSLQHAVDGAVDGAINSIRSSFVAGAGSQSCPVYTAPLFAAPKDLNGAPLGGDTAVTVTCSGVSGGFTGTNRPPFAIQTRVGDITVDGNGNLEVAGPVYSAGRINTNGGPQQRIVVSGDVFSAHPTATCSDDIVASGVVNCPKKTDDPSGDDPFAGLAAPFAALPPEGQRDLLGTCASTTSVVRFEPGHYSETPRPDPTDCTGPNHDTWWFTPGLYYFDFADSKDGSPFTDSDAAWSFPGITVVGGAPDDWDPDTASAAAVRDLTDDGGACDVDEEGVTFVFGGATNISVAANERLELCPATLPGSEQKISLYAWGGNGTRTSASLTSTAGSASSATTDFIDADGARESGNPVATAALVGGVKETAQLALADFDPDVPEGSLIYSAELHVTHAESSNKVEPTITVTSASATSTIDLTSQTSLTTEIVDFPLDEDVQSWRSLQDLTMTYSVDGSTLQAIQRRQAAETATAQVDGVKLVVRYAAPALTPSRCPQGETSCYLLRNTVADRVLLHGTLYAPISDVEVAVHNFSTSVFERGVIVGSLLAHVSPSSKQTAEPFQLPGGTTERLVLFEATVTGESRPRLRARVRYRDYVVNADGVSHLSPGAAVTIEKWTVLR